MTNYGVDAQIDDLKLRLTKMCRLTERMLEDALRALRTQDGALGKAVAQSDSAVDEAEADIERQCMRLLVRCQPFAGDFRHISTILKIITDVERIADQAGDIASLADEFEALAPSETVLRMGDLALTMTRGAVRSFLNEDLSCAARTAATDDRMDELFERVKGELVETVRYSSDCAKDALIALMVAKYFERIGDHCVNIAEWTDYYRNGVHKKP